MPTRVWQSPHRPCRRHRHCRRCCCACCCCCWFRLYDPIGGEHMNVMKAAALTCHRMVAVSHGYAWECQTQEGGWGLDGVMRENNWKFRGEGVASRGWVGARQGLCAAGWQRVGHGRGDASLQECELAGRRGGCAMGGMARASDCGPEALLCCAVLLFVLPGVCRHRERHRLRGLAPRQ